MNTFPAIKDAAPPDADLMQKLAAEAATAIAKERDDLVRQAISKHLGREDWALADILPHMRRVPIFTHPAPAGTLKCEVFSFGETPILELYPAEMGGKGNKLTWTIKHRMLI